MAHGSYIRGSFGAWAPGTTVTQGEFWTIDQAVFEAINGDYGGVWAPSVAIEIGGSGLLLSGANHELSGTLTSSGGTLSGTFAGSPTFDGNVYFDANPVFNGDPTFNGIPSFTAGAALAGTFTGNPIFNGDPTFSGDPYFTGTAEFDAAVQFDGVVTFTLAIAPTLSNPTLEGNLTLDPGSNVSYSVDINSTDADRTLSTPLKHIYYNPDTILSVGRNWTLPNLGSATRVVMITNRDISLSITVRDASFTVIQTVGAQSRGDFLWDGSGWLYLG